MKNKKIYKMEVFDDTTKDFKVLQIGEADKCFEMMDDHAREYPEQGNHYSDYHYYLTGFVDDVYQTIEVEIRDEVHEYNLEL